MSETNRQSAEETGGAGQVPAGGPPKAPELDDSAPDLMETGPGVPGAGGGGGDNDESAAPEPTPEEKRLARRAANSQIAEEGQAALATIGEVETSELMPFTPQNFGAAWKLAWHLCHSGIVSEGLRGNPGAVLSVMARGAYLGIPWAIAVQEAHVVHGKVGWPAALLAAICDTSPTFEYFEVVEQSNDSATVEAKKPRWPEPRRYTVTMEDAVNMGFLDGSHSKLWKSKRPMPMLVAMARREAARLWDPARCAGIYTPDELEAVREERRVDDARALGPGGKTKALVANSGSGPVSASDILGDQGQTEAKPASAPPAADPPANAKLAPGVVTRLCALAEKQGVDLTEVEELYGDALKDLPANKEAEIEAEIRERGAKGKAKR